MTRGTAQRGFCKCGKACYGKQCRECFCKKGANASTRKCMRNYNEKISKSKRHEECMFL